MNRALRRTAALAAIVWMGAVPALAQQAPAPAPTRASSGPRMISLDAEDAYLPSVLKILAEKGDLNIITGPGVTGGRLSIHMRDVPVEQAVNLVVRAAGLAYERIGNSILVADAKSLQEETGLSSYVVELKYADAAEVRDALKNLSAQIEVDKTGNRLIVVTSPRVIAEIGEIVEIMDVPVRQVMLEARIVEVSTDDLQRLGIDWANLARQGMIFVEGNYDTIRGNSAGAANGVFEGLQVFPNTPGTSDIFKLKNFSRPAQVFRVAIDLLIQDGNARVLANPKVATLNGKEATMLVGTRIPYVVSGTTFAGGGAAPTQEVQREEVGIKLGIRPLINADGFITTEIRPEVSSVIGFQGVNNDLPVVATRQATTTVRLKDGNSVIIGGLLSEEKSNEVTKVPLLGDLPLLGPLLFQHHFVQTTKRDLIIEVTPRIMPEQQ